MWDDVGGSRRAGVGVFPRRVGNGSRMYFDILGIAQYKVTACMPPDGESVGELGRLSGEKEQSSSNLVTHLCVCGQINWATDEQDQPAEILYLVSSADLVKFRGT